MRLIDADVAQKIADKELFVDEVGAVQYVLAHTPTIDAVPVVHGRWLRCGFGKEIMCSVCECELKDGWAYRHCPDCGAKMALEVKQ